MRSLKILVGLITTAALLTGCAEERGAQPTIGETEGTILHVGELSYQVQLSRQLNPFDSEDRSYFLGLPDAEAQLKPDQIWFGVWIRVVNSSKSPQIAADTFSITDTKRSLFRPLLIPPDRNPFIYHAEELPEEGRIPADDTPAAVGPTAGSLLLFKVTLRSLQNRPLQLHIRRPRSVEEVSVNLDI